MGRSESLTLSPRPSPAGIVGGMDFDQAHRAIKKGDLASLRQGIPSALPANASNRFGWTLLMLAAIEGNTSVGEFLLTCGAGINVQNDVGETAISLAACGGHLRFVQLLKRNGAVVSNLRPHGHDLATWMRSASGLPDEKIAEVLAAIDAGKHDEFAAGERGR